MGRTNPDSTAFAQVTLIESHPQHAPSISPASAARRISEVPLKPSTTLIGRPRTALSNCGKAEVALPGPRLPSLTGRLEADHSSRFFIPVFSVTTQVCRSGAGVPSQPNFLPSNITPWSPSICLKIIDPEKWPTVNPSGSALLYT